MTLVVMSLCPCTNIHNQLTIPIPPYVGMTTYVTLPVHNNTKAGFTPVTLSGMAKTAVDSTLAVLLITLLG